MIIWKSGGIDQDNPMLPRPFERMGYRNDALKRVTDI